jgi:enoyl-CoA hydratase/carnithine racemase
METLEITRDQGIVVVRLRRGKVNAINDQMVAELTEVFDEMRSDPEVGAVLLTGTGKFFTFGFDIPEFMSWSMDAFTGYLTRFCALYRTVFLYPKPVIAALNGHTIAGGCMLATACDHRLMAAGTAKISLNEIGFGSSVLAGSVAMLQACVGRRNAERILITGAMLTVDEALEMGLVDRKYSQEDLLVEAKKVALDYAERDPIAFESIKMLLRRPIAEDWEKREETSITEFVDIWYSENTRARLREIKIQGRR